MLLVLPQIALAMGVLTSNRRGVGTNFGGVDFGCHCWVPLLGAIAGCHCWVPLLDAIAGCHCWSAIAGCHHACHCWAPLLGCHGWMLATNLGGVHVSCDADMILRQLGLAIGVLTSNRKGVGYQPCWVPLLEHRHAGVLLGAIAGSHCSMPFLGAIAGVPLLDYHCWVPPCRGAAGCHCWVPLLGWHCWVPSLGALPTFPCWVPLLGAIAGCHCEKAIAGCHCEKKLARVIHHSPLHLSLH